MGFLEKVFHAFAIIIGTLLALAIATALLSQLYKTILENIK